MQDQYAIEARALYQQSNSGAKAISRIEYLWSEINTRVKYFRCESNTNCNNTSLEREHVQQQITRPETTVARADREF